MFSKYNELKNHYESFSTLIKDIPKKLSLKTLESCSSKYLGAVIAQRIYLLNKSFSSILPDSSNFVLEEIDFPSLHFFLRNLMESYCSFFYLYSESLNPVSELKENEEEFRLLVWKRHLLEKQLSFVKLVQHEKNELRKELEKKQRSMKLNVDLPLNNVQALIDSTQTDLENNDYYKKLLTKRKSKRELQKVQNCIQFEGNWREEFISRLGLNENLFNVTYDDCSQHIHCYAFSLDKLAVFIDSDNESKEKQAMIRILDTVLYRYLCFLALFLRDFRLGFAEYNMVVTDEEEENIRHYSSLLITV